MNPGAARCARCDGPLPDGIRFCGECGATVDEVGQAHERQVGRFRLGPIVGHGGMGVVHRAYDTDLGREVALKLIAPSLAGDPGFRARFEREARSAAAVDHPNVLPVFEAGDDGGELYIAMRLVEGTDLRALLAREGRLPPRRAAEMIAQIAAALDAAHARDLVHRDVKPANALIARSAGDEGHVYLTDFGLTQIADHAHDLTNPGQVVGTANYVAPEQIDGRPIDGRVDVYALACVAFECMTGEPPFARGTATATLAAHLHDAIPRAATAGGLPAAVDDVLAGGLAKEPANRFASCGALARALGGALGTGIGEVPRDPRVAARARPSPAAPPPTPPLPATDPTLVAPERPARAPAWPRLLLVLLALIAAGGLAAAGAVILPQLLESRDAEAGLDSAGVRLLSETRAVNAGVSDLMSRLARDPTDEVERDAQFERLAELHAEVDRLRVATRSSAPPTLRPLLEQSLQGQERLLDQYRGVLNSPPADAGPLIDAMRSTLDRTDADLRRGAQQ